MTKYAPAEVAAWILQTDYFARDAGGKLWIYESGVYRPGGEERIERRVKDFYHSQNQTGSWHSRVAGQVAAYIAADASVLWEMPHVDRLNVLNGWLNIETLELTEHSPDELSPVQLPVTFKPNAKCPEWDQFVSEVFPSDARHVAYELVALAMLPNLRYQFAVLLLGEGGNGKGTFLRGVRAFLGNENVSALSLHQIQTEKFSRALLYGKLANICPDISDRYLSETDYFKALTGGDTITAEYKFGKHFTFRSYATLFFSCNRPFSTGDDSEGFIQRWRVIPFPNSFRSTSRDKGPELDEALAQPNELSGLLNKALGARKVIQQRGSIDVTPTMDVALDQLADLTGGISRWLRANTVSDPEASIPKRELIDACNGHRRKGGMTVLSDNYFGRNLHRLRPTVIDAQKKLGDDRTVEVYRGIRLKEQGGIMTPAAASRTAPVGKADSADSFN